MRIILLIIFVASLLKPRCEGLAFRWAPCSCEDSNVGVGYSMLDFNLEFKQLCSILVG
jgi:hypothetical protein